MVWRAFKRTVESVWLFNYTIRKSHLVTMLSSSKLLCGFRTSGGYWVLFLFWALPPFCNSPGPHKHLEGYCWCPVSMLVGYVLVKPNKGLKSCNIISFHLHRAKIKPLKTPSIKRYWWLKICIWGKKCLQNKFQTRSDFFHCISAMLSFKKKKKNLLKGFFACEPQSMWVRFFITVINTWEKHFKGGKIVLGFQSGSITLGQRQGRKSLAAGAGSRGCSSQGGQKAERNRRRPETRLIFPGYVPVTYFLPLPSKSPMIQWVIEFINQGPLI